MEGIKKIGIWLVILVMTFACFGMEYYAYELQSTFSKVELTDIEEMVEQVVLENVTKAEKEDRKVAYLTFDDGPSKVTERILDVLNVYQVPATFFVVGGSITKEREPIIERIKEEGHVIGIHTYSHDAKKMYTSADAYLEDFMATEQRIYEVTGIHTKLFRFPWGSTNEYLKKIEDKILPYLESNGYSYFDWNVSAEDAVGHPTSYSILNNVKKDYSRYEKPVLLMHDSATSSLTAEMLPDIIVMLKEGGYRFDTLDHMETPYQYPRN